MRKEQAASASPRATEGRARVISETDEAKNENVDAGKGTGNGEVAGKVAGTVKGTDKGESAAMSKDRRTGESARMISKTDEAKNEGVGAGKGVGKGEVAATENSESAAMSKDRRKNKDRAESESASAGEGAAVPASTEAKIALRMPDGTTIKKDFLPSATLGDVYAFVEQVCE